MANCEGYWVGGGGGGGREGGTQVNPKLEKRCFLGAGCNSKQSKHKLRMYLWWSLCTLYLLACQVRATVGDSGLCCCVSLTSFEPFVFDSATPNSKCGPQVDTN